MQYFSKEKIREEIGLIFKAMVIAMLIIPMVLPTLDLYFLENLPDVPIEGEPSNLKKEDKLQELPEFDWNSFVSIRKEDIQKLEEEEKRLIEAITYLEAGTKPSNQILVAEVIRNRKRHPDFPDDTILVCNQKGQFETVKNGVPIKQNGDPIDMDSIPKMDEVYQKVFVEDSNVTEELLKKEALRKGLYNEKYWKGGALYFSNLDAVSEEVYAKGKYDNIKVCVKIGGNTFWRYWG